MTATADRIALGSMLFTLVEPRPGHEVAYNRWYERDHFYAGCLIGPYTMSGQRWVATADLKALRAGGDGFVAGGAGSYLAIYWILAGRHDEWNRWGVDQVNRLHASGRMFTERDHVHTLLYDHRWTVARDEDGVPPELALDHRYPGLVVTVADGEGVGDALDEWYLDHLGGTLAGTPVGQVLGFSPLPLLADRPSDVPEPPTDAHRRLLLWFLDGDPAEGWDRFAAHAEDVAASGAGRLVWAAPFLPTVPGTDMYTDQLR